MTKTQIILIVVCTIFFVQCQTKTDKPKSIDSNIDSDSLKYFKTDISLTGTGESGIASYYLNWNISIIDNDSIIMLSTLKKDENDVRLNNRQYFGRLIESEKYSYEIKVSEFVAIDGCNKPNNRFLDTDTIPFYIDSTLFNKVS
ncbi:MAG: PBP1b-binding outer membrane lipoprotein LpoB, partial [Polaribacter sp.]